MLLWPAMVPNHITTAVPALDGQLQRAAGKLAGSFLNAGHCRHSWRKLDQMGFLQVGFCRHNADNCNE